MPKLWQCDFLFSKNLIILLTKAHHNVTFVLQELSIVVDITTHEIQ